MKSCIKRLSKGDIIHYHMKWGQPKEETFVFGGWYKFPTRFYAVYEGILTHCKNVDLINITKIIKYHPHNINNK